MPTKRVGEYLESGDGLGHLAAQAASVLRVRKILTEILPENLRRSCKIANIKQGKVVIFAENTAIAAKIRLIEPSLVEQLAQRGGNVSAVRVEVQVSTPARRTAGKQARLSAPATGALRDLELRLPEGTLRDLVGSLARKNG